MMTTPQTLSIQVGLPRTLGSERATDPLERAWVSGIFKESVEGSLWLGRTNLAGDGQGDLVNHGGPEKAVCVYPVAHYPFWQVELAARVLPYGSFGENFTVAELTEAEACVGDVYDIGVAGGAQVQVSQPRQPCWKLARRWRIKDLAARVQRTGYTGWYFRVLREGYVEPNAALILVERLFPEWTVARANEVMHRRRGDDREAAAALAACPLLTKNWRHSLAKRAATGETSDERRRLIGQNEV